MSDEPFGRQPKPIRVYFTGEQIDVDHYSRMFAHFIDNHGDNIQRVGNTITIYPRAVND